MFYAHSSNQDDQWQLLKDHLQNVGALAGLFASKFGAQELGCIAGLLHDIGKYSVEFQRRLRGDNIRVDHSTAGAQTSNNLYGLMGQLLAYVIAGHHAGIPDGGNNADTDSLIFRLRNRTVADFSAYINEITLPTLLGSPPLLRGNEPGFSISFLIRMLFSCLTDADYLDTERHMNTVHSHARAQELTLANLNQRLKQYMDKFSVVEDSLVNRVRRDVLASCLAKAKEPTGLYTLNVPTGGGKTLSSLAFALEHAHHHNKDRVVYVIPYNSIIEQNAAVFRGALGDDAVLEHHCQFTYPDEPLDEWRPELRRHSLATENWDMPLIVTTSVQFYESLFSNKSSRCRKLHNLTNSIIIIDEAQILPTDYLLPCLTALGELVANYGTTVVLCTATQPAISGLLTHGLHRTEIMPDPVGLSKLLKRVEVEYLGARVDDELVHDLQALKQVLCIVNTTTHAYELFEQLSGMDGVFHLSGHMCPAHRSETLATIREQLKRGLTCRVISTQLVEAGVDLDFPVVYRAIAGLDSIIQAAGRCNREGRLAVGKTFVFQPSKIGLPKGWFTRVAKLADITMSRYPQEPLSLEAIESYFSELYDVQGDKLDAKGILQMLKEDVKGLRFPFAEIANKFSLIETTQQPVIIPFNAVAEDLIEKASYAKHPSAFVRRLQPYTVQVYPDTLQALVQMGVVTKEGDLYWVLKDLTLYDKKTGLTKQGVTGTTKFLHVD